MTDLFSNERLLSRGISSSSLLKESCFEALKMQRPMETAGVLWKDMSHMRLGAAIAPGSFEIHE